jgi:hypothetical protein
LADIVHIVRTFQKDAFALYGDRFIEHQAFQCESLSHLVNKPDGQAAKQVRQEKRS